MELSVINESEKEQSVQNISGNERKVKKNSTISNLAFLKEFHKIYENDKDKLSKFKHNKQGVNTQRRKSVDSNFVQKNRISIFSDGKNKSSSLKKTSVLKNRRHTLNLTNNLTLTGTEKQRHPKQSIISFNLPPKEIKSAPHGLLSPMKINDRRRSVGMKQNYGIEREDTVLNRSNSMNEPKKSRSEVKRRSGKRSNLTLGQAVKEINKPYITFNKRNSQIGPFIKINRLHHHKPQIFKRRDSFSDYSILARGSLRLRTDYYKRRVKIIVQVIGTIAFIKNEIIKFGIEPRSMRPFLEDDEAALRDNTVLNISLYKTIFKDNNGKIITKKPWYIIHPDSKFTKLWHSFILILSTLFCIYYPFRMAYTDTFYNFDCFAFLVLDIIVEAIYLVDIVKTFFTAYENQQGQLISSLRWIFVYYLSSLWLIIDMIYTIPFLYLGINLILDPHAEYIRSDKAIMFLLMFRVLKALFRINEISFVEKIREMLRVNTGVVKVIFFFTNTVILCHIFACVWYFNAVCENFNPDTWVFRYDLLDEDIGLLYLKSLYFAYVVFITVGYGDITAFTNSKDFD
jgi:hypothetical protein